MNASQLAVALSLSHSVHAGDEDPKRKRRKLKEERLNAARKVLRRANIDAEPTVLSEHPARDKKKSKKSKTKKRKRHKDR